MVSKKLIFVLPNIYEAVNGVSNKYIKFIDFLINEKINIDITVITTFKNKELYTVTKNKYNTIKIIKTRGIIIPFYKDIKIPIIKDNLLEDEIKEQDDIYIIFNSEFIWLYDILKKLKTKYKYIKIYPTWHTNYIYYAENVYLNYNVSSFCNHLNYYLENKNFNGIVVTGENNKNKFITYTDRIFNANEINLDIFKNVKYDTYNTYTPYTPYNIIYTGRISKEKNIDEFLEFCVLLNTKYDIIINIIGDGPYLSTLKESIMFKYKSIKEKIVFYGNLSQNKINDLYQKLDNRIFLFNSVSETFGKTPMEAAASGIPVFIKLYDVSESIYINKENAFIFTNKEHFMELFEYFVKMDSNIRELFIYNSSVLTMKYEQNNIFKNWIEFLIEEKVILKNTVKINLYDFLTFQGITKLINCSGNIMAD